MNLSLATLGGAVMGAAAGAGLALMPTPMLEGLVMDSGIPAIVAAAQPPLGMTARLAIAGGIGAVVALIGWFAMFLMFGTRGLTIGKARPAVSEVPVIRRADAHPDAPPRPPLLATRDLGVPFLDVTAEKPAEAFAPPPSPADVAAQAPLFAAEPVAEAAPEKKLFAPKHVVAQIDEQDLPVDLDQPLSAFDPTAIPASPAAPTPTVASLRRPLRPSVFEEGERFETFELTPIRREPVPPPVPAPRPAASEAAIVRPETDATIHALLDRLEKGVVRRGLAEPAAAGGTRAAERGLEDALVTLRNLARRA